VESTPSKGRPPRLSFRLIDPVQTAASRPLTRYLDAAVAELEAAGHDIPEADKARLSPLKERHLDYLGRYPRRSQPGLRPLRDPATRADPEEQ
jgi:hypothetical protein